MFLRFVSFFCLFSFICMLLPLSNAEAADEVSLWLRQMGCDDLLAAHLEERLASGDNKEKISAALELANLYSLFLSRDTDGSDIKTIEKATALLTKVPQEGVTDLRLQLLRVKYLSSEHTLERYRLRLATKEQADTATELLALVANELEKVRTSLLRKSRSKSEKKLRQIGLSSSLLAWSKYYIAWHQHDENSAKEASLVFASILLSETASLSTVSFDLKSTEYGARAILGIALCKDLIRGSEGADPWFDIIDDANAWNPVRSLVPMWKFFLDIERERWSNVLQGLHTVSGADMTVLLRLAAVHALEHYDKQMAQRVAQDALAKLVQMTQLVIVSEIVEKYGFNALSSQGFITKYIQGDQAYHKARKSMFGDTPIDNPNVKQQFLSIASIFREALKANDSGNYPQLTDDCYYMLGLSLFYASSHIEAANAFQDAAKGDKSEQAIWMAIVSLDHVKVMPTKYVGLKEQIIEQYIEAWPNTQRATQLLLLLSNDLVPKRHRIEDLLDVARTDPRYEFAQRQAAQLLYQTWRLANPYEKVEVGNRYISVAVPLMLADHELIDDDNAMQRAAVRAFRLLEVALHPEVKRLVAADKIFVVLSEIQQAGRYGMEEMLSELAYRKVIASIYAENVPLTHTQVEEMMLQSPDDEWTLLAARAVWRSWNELSEVSTELRYSIGIRLLQNLTDSEVASPKYLAISTATARVAFELYLRDVHIETAQDALRISRVLLLAYPKSRSILQMNATFEEEIGKMESARSHWRAIATGSERGSLEWIEARFHIIAILAQEKPEEAIALIEQHRTMYPTYGLDPYGTMIRELYLKLKGDQNGR